MLQTRCLALLAALSLTLFAVACGPSTSPGQTSGASVASTTTAPLPPLMVTICLDRTPSFDRTYFNAGKNMLADAIQWRAGDAGQQGATVFVTLIGHNSYATSSTVRTIVIPPSPQSDVAPTPTTNPNIFDTSTVTAAARATAAATSATATAIAKQSSQIMQQVQPDIAFLRGLNPPTDSPTDIVGCVSRAAERFQAAPAGTQKILLMVTDLREAGPQQDDILRPLNGVTVKVFEWECDDAPTCDNLKSQWHDEFVTKDHAASVVYYDPSESQAQLAGHLFDVNP